MVIHEWCSKMYVLLRYLKHKEMKEDFITNKKIEEIRAKNELIKAACST